VSVANSTNLELLEYTKNLLKIKYGIKSNIYLCHNTGQQDSILEGRVITRTKNVYVLNIQKIEGTIIFLENIGFSIKRKQEKLTDGIEIITKFDKKQQIKIWKEKYSKQKNKRWRKLN
jgi:intein-encoded DNA endonuclease-like protein